MNNKASACGKPLHFTSVVLDNGKISCIYLHCGCACVVVSCGSSVVPDKHPAECLIHSIFMLVGEPTVVEMEKDESLFVLIHRPDFCLVFGGWRILRRFRERQVTNRESLLGKRCKSGL